MGIKVRVEYDVGPITHIVIQCPECGDWFNAIDISSNPINENCDITYNNCTCPICGNMFDGTEIGEWDVEEVSYPDIYKGVKRKVVAWE